MTPPDRNLYSVESIAYHEGIPGHHLQISIAQELTGSPSSANTKHYTAYTEGWAFYAEHLAKISAYIKTLTPITAGLKTTPGAPSASSLTPASTPRAGPASRWSSTSTTTRN